MVFGRLTSILIALAAAAGIALFFLVTSLAANRVESQIRQEATQSANLLGALLASEIEHYQALPITLATDGEIQNILLHRDASAEARLSRRLGQISDQIGSAAIYLVTAQGKTIAASNAGTPSSFVGVDYRFRQYFRDAMRIGRGNQFAMGSTTRRPGLYLSQRVDHDGRALGVLVVKVEFDSLESDWQRSGTAALVTDAQNTIIITTVAPWRFRDAGTVLREAGQTADRYELRLDNREAAQNFIRGRAETIVPGWTLHALVPIGSRINDAVTAAAAITTLALMVGAAVALWTIWRLRQARLKELTEEQARRDLELRVDLRTLELRDSNQRLVEEMVERRRAEESAQLLHEELEQANRLATLGQIAAGVTHEINQPVAAIRATADNVGTMLDRGQVNPARAGISKIAKLTERIGAITGELRSFSAKRSGEPRLVSVDSAIDGALVLVGTSLRQAGITLTRSPRSSQLKLWADKIRVEQILVNLIRNAIDVLDDCEGPQISILVRPDGDQVELLVTDNGSGIADDVAATLFTPFRTTKPHGLGLGLVISRDIAASLGGELNLLRDQSAPDGSARHGSTFQLLLPRAT